MVEIDNISYRYKKKTPLFDRLSLKLKPGHIYGLLGKNGAGKSTLIKHICSLIFPSQGQIRVNGWNVKERLPAMLSDMYLVPEEFELPSFSIANYVKHHAAFYPKFNHSQLSEYLREFEIPLENKISGMSYGQKKKFLISFGLATNASVLILDEPTNGLDIPSKSQFRKMLASSLDEKRMVIISTHQVHDLENLIDVVLILEQGKIIFNKEVSEVSMKLAFEDDLEGVAPSEILHFEEARGRKIGISKNTSGVETSVNLELLFNAVVKNASAINNLF